MTEQIRVRPGVEKSLDAARMSGYATILLLCILGGCRREASSVVVVDPALATLVPSDTIWLAGIRMEPIRPTPLYQKYVVQQPLPPQLQDFIKETGLDPRQDLWEFLAGGDGKNVLVMARGKFSEHGLEPKLAAAGRIPYKGYTLIGNEQTSVMFMNSSTAVAGSAKALRGLIDRRDKNVSGIPAALIDRIKQIPSTNQIWFVDIAANQIPALSARDSGDLANLNNFIGRLDTLTATVDLRSGFKARIEATAASDRDAKQMHDAAKALIGMGRLSTPDDKKELLRAYDNISVTQQQRNVLVDADIPMDLVEQLQKVFISSLPGSRLPGSSSRHPR